MLRRYFTETRGPRSETVLSKFRPKPEISPTRLIMINLLLSQYSLSMFFPNS